MADALTIWEKLGRVEDTKVCYYGIHLASFRELRVHGAILMQACASPWPAQMLDHEGWGADEYQ